MSESPPGGKKSLKRIDEDPKGILSGVVSIEKEGDESSGAGSQADTASEDLSSEPVPAESNDAMQKESQRRSRGYGKRQNSLGKGMEALKKHPMAGSGEIVAEPELEAEAAQEAPAATPLLPEEPSAIDTPKEGREALRAAVAQFDDVPKPSAVPEERAAMRAAETAYLAAYKELEKKRTVWGRLRNGKELTDESARVEELKRAYDEARVAHANAITRSVGESASQRSLGFEARTQIRYERLKESGALPRTEGGDEISFEAFMQDAYAKRSEKAEGAISNYLRFREVIRPAAEKKIQARIEALDARGKNVFEKGLAFAAAQNQALEAKHGKNKARVIRAAAGAIIFTGGAALAGSFGTAGILALAGAGSVKFIHALAGTLAGTAAGEGMGLAYEKLVGRKAQAAAKEMLRDRSVADDLTVESLQDIDATREKLASRADEATFQKKKNLVKALTAMGVGAGTAVSLAELFPIQQAADMISGSVEASADSGGSLSADTSSGANLAEVPEPAAEASNATPTVPEGPMLREVDIDRGEGFNQLFVDLRASGMEPATAVGKYLMNGNISASQLSQEIGALDFGNEADASASLRSAVMLEGDTLALDKNENLWFIREGQEPRLLMWNDPQADSGVAMQELKGMDMQSNRVNIAEIHDAATVTETSSEGTNGPMPSAATEPFSEHASVESPAAPLTDENASTEIAYAGNIIPDAGEATAVLPAHEAPATHVEPMHEARDLGTHRVTGITPIGQYDADAHLRELEGASTESFANAHAIEVNPSVPGTYELEIPGTDAPLMFAFGGDAEAARGWALRELQVNPSAHMHVNYLETDTGGAPEMRVGVWSIGEDGQPAFERNVENPATGRPLSAADPDDFTRKLS